MQKVRYTFFLLGSFGFIISFLFSGFIFSFFVDSVNARGVKEAILSFEKEIEDKKRITQELEAQQQVYAQKISQKRKERVTLANQLAVLEDQMIETDLKVRTTESHIEEIKLEMEKLKKEVDLKNQFIFTKKEQLAALIRNIHQLDQRNFLETLLLSDQFTDMFLELEHLSNIQDDLRNALIELSEGKKELEIKIQTSADKKRELELMQNELSRQKERLEEQKGLKQTLISGTRSSEERFQELLILAKREQEEANQEIVSLETKVKEKLAELKKEEALQQLSSDFRWPVTKNTITTYFYDPDYPFRHIFEHPGLDIRAEQGTRIKASAGGYVARAKDAGYGYSYIMLIHSNNFATVYGHVSCILVEEDTFVTKGQDIGCVGGLPGTRGAGRLTTGPHLHFEIRQNGIPVDPLQYLP